MGHPTSDQEHLLHTRNISQSSPSFSVKKPSSSPLGKPARKKAINVVDILTASVSLICFTLAVAAVASESFSWRLGQGNNQLIVVGFLLSIMNLCLTSVAPTLFLLLEARFGSSTLQNYNGILRGQVLASRLGITWRLILALMLALPIVLSISYKRFKGGESMRIIDPINLTANTSYYGIFAPPGLQSLGEKSGTTLFFNATLPFTLALAESTATNPESPLPTNVQPYGYNVLLLNNESTAMLDMPQPSYLSAILSLLAEGESWNLTAPVLATVATFNNSKEEDPGGWNSTFMSTCYAAEQSSGAYSKQTGLNNWAVELVSNPSPGNQSGQYIGVCPDPGIEYITSCSNFSYYAQRYDVTRQQ